MHTLVSLGCACVLLMFGNHSLVKDPAVALSTNWILGSPARPRSKSASAGKGATRACDDRETDAETVEVARWPGNLTSGAVAAYLTVRGRDFRVYETRAQQGESAHRFIKAGIRPSRLGDQGTRTQWDRDWVHLLGARVSESPHFR